jgi:hypothetical protein
VCGPQKGLAELASAASDDWALRPVNSILCHGQRLGRHEWVSTMCATADRNERPGIHAETFRRIHPPTRALIAAPGPRLASLCSAVLEFGNRGLDTPAVMGVPFSALSAPGP